jgi:hypothetical protein
MSVQVLTAGVFPSVDFLGSYTVHDNKMLKHPPKQNSVTLKTDIATPSESRTSYYPSRWKKKKQTTLKR